MSLTSCHGCFTRIAHRSRLYAFEQTSKLQGIRDSSVLRSTTSEKLAKEAISKFPQKRSLTALVAPSPFLLHIFGSHRHYSQRHASKHYISAATFSESAISSTSDQLTTDRLEDGNVDNSLSPDVQREMSRNVHAVLKVSSTKINARVPKVCHTYAYVPTRPYRLRVCPSIPTYFSLQMFPPVA